MTEAQPAHARHSPRVPTGACESWRDISVPIRVPMPLWPGEHNRLEHTFARRMDAGDPVTVSHLACGMHTATHIDAPLHHVPGGDPVGRLDLAAMNGPVLVHDLGQVAQAITPADLEGLSLDAAPRCLFKTRNSELWASDRFDEEYVFITPEAAALLVEAGVILVGIDYLSVESFHAPTPETHRILLGRGTIILEGIDLRGVRPGRYELLCLPLHVPAAEAAPARAFLLPPTPV